MLNLNHVENLDSGPALEPTFSTSTAAFEIPLVSCDVGLSRPCSVTLPYATGMSGPKKVIWRILTRSMSPHVANDGIVDAATARYMHRDKTTRDGMEMDLGPYDAATAGYTGRGLVLRLLMRKNGAEDIPVEWGEG